MVPDDNRAMLEGERYEALVGKCQENGWLRRGGYAWQGDPYLEEYPYSFQVIDGIDALREAFASGNYAIRQGFVYEDLAFVRQMNGGDEWWTRKLAGDGDKAGDWVDFESWSFGPVLRQRKGDPAGQFSTSSGPCRWQHRSSARSSPTRWTRRAPCEDSPRRSRTTSV